MISSFLQIRRVCLLTIVHKKSQNWFAFTTVENSETLESSAINDGRSMFAIFLPRLYVECMETETLKKDFMQYDLI